MPSSKKIADLFARYLAGECSKEELFELYQHFGIEKNEALLKTLIKNEFEKPIHGTDPQTLQPKSFFDSVLKKLKEDIKKNE